MEELLLVTESRGAEASGTRNSRRSRAEGLVPGIVYGQGEDTSSVFVRFKDLRAVLSTDAGLNAIIGLEVDGKHKLSIVKDLQRHPINQSVLHVDFLLINPDEEVQVDVPISLAGVAKKVEQEQGIVDQILFELTVLAKPDSIPNILEFDITDLEVGDSVTVGDLTMPPGSRTALDPATPVASAELTRMALVEEAPVVAEGEEGEEVEGEEGAAEGEEGDGVADDSGAGEDAGKDGGEN